VVAARVVLAIGTAAHGATPSLLGAARSLDGAGERACRVRARARVRVRVRVRVRARARARAGARARARAGARARVRVTPVSAPPA